MQKEVMAGSLGMKEVVMEEVMEAILQHIVFPLVKDVERITGQTTHKSRNTLGK